MKKYKCLVCNTGKIVTAKDCLGYCSGLNTNDCYNTYYNSHYAFSYEGNNKVIADRITTPKYRFTRYIDMNITFIGLIESSPLNTVRLDYILCKDSFDINQVDEIIDNLLILS